MTSEDFARHLHDILSRYGIDAPTEEFLAALAEMATAYAEAAGRPLDTPILPARTGGVTSDLVRSWGLVPVRGRDSAELRRRAIGESAAWAVLVCHSYTTREAAEILGVTAGAIRARIGPTRRSLYGFRSLGRWRLPRFQFMGDDTLPYIELVLPHVPENASPVAVHLWFVDPNPALVDPATGDPLSPREWLLRGYSPEPLRDLLRQMKSGPRSP